MFGAGDHLYDDRATMSALRPGRLLVYGTHTGNSVDMEVIADAPLTRPELADGLWLQAGPGHIDLPSGHLCIRSCNSLPIGGFEPDPTEPGGRADVPPGRYRVRLYRKSGVAPEADNSAHHQGLPEAASGGNRRRPRAHAVRTGRSAAGGAQRTVWGMHRSRGSDAEAVV